jgi:hypothetical protein
LFDWRVYLQGFGLFERFMLFDGIVLGFWTMAKQLSYVGCAGCCTHVLFGLGECDESSTRFG